MANTYTLIEKITVGAAGASSITFTSIPQTYTDLLVVLSLRSARPSQTNSSAKIYFNSNTSNYTWRELGGNGATAFSNNGSTPGYTYIPATNATASTFGNAYIYIPNYTSSNNKSYSMDGVDETNASTIDAQTLFAGLWSNSSAITSITIEENNSSTFVQYTTAYLYGIAKEGVTPAPSSAPYATGGDSIVFDGTYWIHTFYSSGTFTPKKGLTCDYLVVAGGGGGGRVGGGGGAGGLRSTVTATGGGGSLESALSLAANTGYTVTIGAGGAGSTDRANKGSNGSNSVFSTITSTAGGGGGSYNNASGATGGSGGGTTWSGQGGTGGSGTANQGYAGGTSSGGASSGGGGASAVGANGTSSGGGAGGAGVASSITGSSVTRAGGGGGGGGEDGGGNQTSAGAGGSGGGGAGSTGTANATSGTANTGGGGGGSRDQAGGGGNGGAGGSGIVIVRYAA
jgi:hypothetical protein